MLASRATAKGRTRASRAHRAAAKPAAVCRRVLWGGYYYGGGYHYDDDWDDDWDDGEVWAVGLGAAALGYVVETETAETTSTTTVYTTPPPAGYTSLPCSPNVVPANGVTYYQCGSTWYTQAYGGSGVSYMVVAPPPGH